MNKLLVITLFLPIYLFANDEKIGDRTVYVDEEDIAMNEAIKKARSTLDDFLALYASPPDGAENFKLKVMVSDEYGVEHFWFIPFKPIEGGFSGVLANEPALVQSVEFGQVYNFKKEQITDWGYELNGKQYGSYTVCALFNFMEKEVVETYKNDHGFICEP